MLAGPTVVQTPSKVAKCLSHLPVSGTQTDKIKLLMSKYFTIFSRSFILAIIEFIVVKPSLIEIHEVLPYMSAVYYAKMIDSKYFVNYHSTSTLQFTIFF